MGVSGMLTVAPGRSSWRLRPAVAALRPPSRTVAERSTCGAQVAAVTCVAIICRNGPFVAHQNGHSGTLEPARLAEDARQRGPACTASHVRPPDGPRES